MSWFEGTGITSAFIVDLESDENPELVVFDFRSHEKTYLNSEQKYTVFDLFVSTYGTVDGKVELLNTSNFKAVHDNNTQLRGDQGIRLKIKT